MKNKFFYGIVLINKIMLLVVSIGLIILGIQALPIYPTNTQGVYILSAYFSTLGIALPLLGNILVYILSTFEFKVLSFKSDILFPILFISLHSVFISFLTATNYFYLSYFILFFEFSFFVSMIFIVLRFWKNRQNLIS